MAPHVPEFSPVACKFKPKLLNVSGNLLTLLTGNPKVFSWEPINPSTGQSWSAIDPNTGQTWSTINATTGQTWVQLP